MHTAYYSPSSAPAAPLMPVSDTVHERFIRLPEVMHLCGLSARPFTTSSAGKPSRNKSPSVEKMWRGRTQKSRHG